MRVATTDKKMKSDSNVNGYPLIKEQQQKIASPTAEKPKTRQHHNQKKKKMTTMLRSSSVSKQPQPVISATVEGDHKQRHKTSVDHIRVIVNTSSIGNGCNGSSNGTNSVTAVSVSLEKGCPTNNVMNNNDGNANVNRKHQSLPSDTIETQEDPLTPHAAPTVPNQLQKDCIVSSLFGDEDCMNADDCEHEEKRKRTRPPLPVAPRKERKQEKRPTQSSDVTTTTIVCKEQSPPTPTPQQQQQQQLVVARPRNQEMSLVERIEMVKQDEIELEKLARHYDALLRTPGKVRINPRDSDLVSNMNGMGEVSKMLWTTIVKPRIDKEGVASTIGAIGSLHFCVVGRWGSGKRTAIRSICAAAGVEVWTINPFMYVEGDLRRLIWIACRRRPAVVLLDDFEMLSRSKEFVYEVMHEIDASPDLRNKWDGVWIGALLWDNEELERLPWVKDFCGQRIACVQQLTGREAATMLTERFLLEHNIEISPCLTMEQLDTLSDAAEGCTPGELKEFASAIMYRILNRTEITKFGATETQPSASQVKRYGNVASEREVDRIRKWRLSWEDDVVPLYKKISAQESEDGVERFFIPKKTKQHMSILF